MAETEGSPAVLKLKEMLGYQEHSIVSREIIQKPSGTMTVFAFDKGEGLASTPRLSTPRSICWKARPRSASTASHIRSRKAR